MTFASVETLQYVKYARNKKYKCRIAKNCFEHTLIDAVKKNWK